jgi:ribosomal protein S12 methylthiotransferase
VGLISLGCAKNLVDGEVMLGALLKAGVEITNDPGAADAVILNTCSFIDAAQEESVDAILESAAVRAARQRSQALIVAGCLPQRFREDLPKLLPEVDAFIGIDQVTQVPAIVRQALDRRADGRARRETGTQAPRRKKARVVSRLAELAGGSATAPAPADAKAGPGSAGPLVAISARPCFVPDFATPRFRLTPRHFAYVKIAEGCNHPCSFCIIPRIRGRHRSRRPADIVEEARRLLAEGVRELNLISQDSTYYGRDLRSGSASPARPTPAGSGTVPEPGEAATLSRLLRELNSLPGEFWIRLLYTHPAHWTDELIRTLAECPKVARYVDMPLQHIHDNLLERMRRETSRQHIVDLIRRIRAGMPGITLRTTFIVGFPGETERCFETLLDFIRDTRFERLGVFTYSREEGTRAAAMQMQVSDRVKRERRERAMALQRDIAWDLAGSQVGRTLKVLVEKQARPDELQAARVTSWEHGQLRGGAPHADRLPGPYAVARGEADAPDIDGRVYVRGRMPPGEFARVRVVGHTDYDLIAVPG